MTQQPKKGGIRLGRAAEFLKVPYQTFYAWTVRGRIEAWEGEDGQKRVDVVDLVRLREQLAADQAELAKLERLSGESTT